MARQAVITVLGMSVLLAACQPSPHFNSQPSGTNEHDSTAPGSQKSSESPELTALPAAPQVGYTLANPTPLYPSDRLDTPSATLPGGTAVPVLAKHPQSVEVRVAIGSGTYRAWVRPTDIFLGSQEQAHVEIETRRCEAGLGRPGSGEILSGRNKNPPPPQISPDYTTDDEFLDLGLSEARGYDDPGPVPMVRRPAGDNLLEVTASPSSDVYVKVKDFSGFDVVGFFVHAGRTEQVEVENGRYRIYFAYGKRFSTVCDKFMTDMRVEKDPSVVNLDGGKKLTYGLQRRASPYYSANTFQPARVEKGEF